MPPSGPINFALTDDGGRDLQELMNGGGPNYNMVDYNPSKPAFFVGTD
jgi:hypothetical protein